jgi:hypothetical protein
MARAWLVLVAVLLGLPAPAAAAGSAAPEPDFIALNPRGVGHNESTDPTHLVFTVDMYSLPTGERVGSLTDVITCSAAAPPPCLVFDIVTIYRLPGGDIVNHGYWSGVPDPQRPGFMLAGTRPAADTITSGTGRFAGARGRVNGWGSIDARKLPGELAYDMFTVIHLRPGEGDVLGRSEVFSVSSPAAAPEPGGGFIAQYFKSYGANHSSTPGSLLVDTSLFSLSTGALWGTAVDEVTCSTTVPPCLVLNVLTTFRYPGGTLAARSTVSLVPDPQRPGFALVGTRPERNTLTSASGDFAGRTGRLLLSGTVDLRRFPARAPFEGVSLIRFSG